MSSLIVTQGLQRIGVQASQATGTGVTYDVARFIRTQSLDDGTGALAAGNTDASDPGAITSFIDRALDTSTRSSQTITHACTFTTAEGNFTIRKILLHDDTTANVNSTSATLVGGFAEQSIAGTTEFTKKFFQDITYS